MLFALACAAVEPGPLALHRVEGTFRVESAAMGTEGILAQRKSIRAAQDAWAAAHPELTVAHRFDTMPFVAARSGGDRLQELPAMPLRTQGKQWVVATIGRGFTDLADGACFTDGDCPGDLGFTTASAACAGCPAAEAGIRVFDAEGRVREIDLLRALEFVHTRWAAEHRVAAVLVPFGMVGDWDDPLRCARDNPSLAWIVTALRNDGIAVVAAAGDQRVDGRLPAPACVPGVVSVAATGANGVSDLANLAPFLSLAAPGASGSAEAADFVADRIAALRKESPEASLPDIETALFGDTVEVPGRGGRRLRAVPP